MNKISRKTLLALVIAFVFWVVWQKVRIWVMIPLSPLQAILFFGVAIVVIFLIVDHFLNGGR